MRDMVTCFSEHAIRISETTCSSYINHDHHPNLNPSIPNTLTYLYKTTLNSNPNTLLITISWSKNPLGHGDLTIHFGENVNPSNSFKLNTFSRLFRKKKGQKSLDFDSSKINIYWDFSSANYDSGPEPVNGYYVLLVADPDIILLSLGDLAEAAVTKRLKNDYNNEYKLVSKSVLISQREYYTGYNTLYSTKVQFCDSGISHEVVIRCSEDHDKMKQPVLYVSIDKRNVIKIRRLQWNFRGNQTVFVDGLLVDLMWDVHDWFYNPFSGSAVFLFKTRSGGETRLWLEDKFVQKDQQNVEFSLIIYASKS